MISLKEKEYYELIGKDPNKPKGLTIATINFYFKVRGGFKQNYQFQQIISFFDSFVKNKAKDDVNEKIDLDKMNLKELKNLEKEMDKGKKFLFEHSRYLNNAIRYMYHYMEDIPHIIELCKKTGLNVIENYYDLAAIKNSIDVLEKDCKAKIEEHETRTINLNNALVYLNERKELTQKIIEMLRKINTEDEILREFNETINICNKKIKELEGVTI